MFATHEHGGAHDFWVGNHPGMCLQRIEFREWIIGNDRANEQRKPGDSQLAKVSNECCPGKVFPARFHSLIFPPTHVGTSYSTPNCTNPNLYEEIDQSLAFQNT